MSRSLGSRIRAARVYAGFDSRPELARRVEMSESTLQRIEHDDRPVKRAELLAIAEVCKVPMWFLESGWDGWREAPPPGAVDEEARAALNDIEGQKPRKEVTG